MSAFKISFLLTTIFVLFSCTTKNKVDNKANVEAIRNVSTAVVKAWNEGDYEGYIKFIDDGAIFLPPNAPPIKGIEAIASLYSNSFKRFRFEVNNTIEEIQVSGDYAHQLGTWIGSINPIDGSTPIKFNNKVLSIYKRQPDGTWKIYRSMYSSNKTPEEMHIPKNPESQG